MAELKWQDALFLDEVLENIFKNLPLKELKGCRQVCKKWEEISIMRMSKETQLRLNGDIARNSLIAEFYRKDFAFIPGKLIIEIGGEQLVQELLHKFLNNQVPNNGYTRSQEIIAQLRSAASLQAVLARIYAKNPELIDEYYGRLNEGLEEISKLGKQSFLELEFYVLQGFPNYPAGHLINILGHLSNSLELLNISGIPQDAISAGQSVSEPQYPLLKQLWIGSAQSRIPIWFLKSIFAFSPNLKEIKGYSSNIPRILENSGTLKSVKTFNFPSFAVSPEELEMFSRECQNMEELHLSIEKANNAGDSLSQLTEFVKGQSNSLKCLDLNFGAYPVGTFDLHGTKFGFIMLNKLFLKLPYRKNFILGICFTKDTPQLKHLKIEAIPGDLERDWKDFLAYRRNAANYRVMPFKTLTHLDLLVEHQKEPELGAYLKEVFPSLTTLNLTRPRKLFLRGIWQLQSLMNLHLDLKGHSNDIGDLGVALFGTEDDLREDDMSIVNLKNLQYLCIKKEKWNVDGVYIPDDTVRNGFGRMKHLAVLKLSTFNMTKKAYNYLRKNLHHLKDLAVLQIY